MKLQQKLDEMREGSKARIPAESLRVMHQATEELANSGILDRVAGKGERFPSFALENERGELIISEQLLSEGPLVVTFYRGVW